MHELSMTEELLNLALSYARTAGAGRITGVHVALGEMSSLTRESVCFYWDMISAGTLAEGAALTFRQVPAVLHCAGCGNDGPAVNGDASCPKCGSVNIRLRSGDEFVLEALELAPAIDPEGIQP
jgi:hydrogenase nickel incorporation protein HypA/HybF